MPTNNKVIYTWLRDEYFRVGQDKTNQQDRHSRSGDTIYTNSITDEIALQDILHLPGPEVLQVMDGARFVGVLISQSLSNHLNHLAILNPILDKILLHFLRKRTPYVFLQQENMG